ncbi:hypothetical protein D3C81_1526380 [compost metagenome]
MFSGNQGINITSCSVPFAAVPAWLMSWSGFWDPPSVMICRLIPSACACLRIRVSCSTAVVTKSVSASLALMDANCELMSCAAASMVLVSPIATPFCLSMAWKASAEPRPQSLLTTRKSALRIFSGPTCGAKLCASIALVGLMRNT